MYTYKFVKVDHSMWTGRPKENIEEIILHYSNRGWRLVQIVQDYGSMWYRGRLRTKVVFEKEVTEQTYEPLYRDEGMDSFV